MKRNQTTTNHKQICWHCFSNLLFVNCIVLGYSSLNINSTIRDLKLKGIPKYKQMRTWPTNIFTLFLACPELYEDLFQICFYLSSAKLNMTVFFCIMIDSIWIFHSRLPLIHISCCFFGNYCHLLSFLKNHKIVMSLTFTL